jgi:Amt family ammonium transporter
MQAGFALLECGLTRAKNAVNIMTKNFLDFCFGALLFWALGYALMYGENGNGFVGWDSNLVFMEAMDKGSDNLTSVSWLFQIVFAATAATIVSGAMSERTKLVAYVAYSILITVCLYPITGHWIWGGNGWLSGMGMRDFAGSTVVHSVGAWAALAGAILIGPRIGKFRKDGRPNVIQGHNLPMATLGCFILWFGWYGFNAGSTLAAVDGIAHIAVTTTLSAAAGGIAATGMTWLLYGKPDLSMGLNGCLAGLVGITAGCASVSGKSAVIIGLLAGVLVYASCLFLERKLKVDDPVGAISVHGTCGIWGTLAVGLFGEGAIDIRYLEDKDTVISDGLFFGGGIGQLQTQLIGVVAVFAFAFSVAFCIFFILKKTIGLRVSPEEEYEGLDMGEHGLQAYPKEHTL